MKILAIETSTMLGGIAVMDESSLIVESRLNVKSTHSERLMTEIEHCLKQANINISDIDVFAVATGPGSFTGLRIGLSTVKGFSYATGKPIVSVPTLEAFAWNFPYSKYPVCPMLDARKKEVYAALFEWKNEGFAKIVDEASIDPVELSKKLLRMSYDGFICAGEGVVLYRDKIKEILGSKALFPMPEKSVPSPANVAALGLKKALLKEFSEPVSLAPRYIRKSEAEVKWKGSL